MLGLSAAQAVARNAGINLSPGSAKIEGHVCRHVSKNGKMVSPPRRTKPNKKKLDNFGSKGNLNP
ncbi:MAG: hypothetical protein HZA20_09345 [Nitrospirae bacterium]|nr:hypothetical protein [Nitrospirota bacterium]